jgi:hypothetical protein
MGENERGRPIKGQNRPNEMDKIELKFRQIIFCMEDRTYMMVYGDGNCFEFFAIVSETPSPKHHEIQEFAKNYRISAMRIKEIFVF